MVNRQIDAMAELQNAFSVLFKNWVLAIPTALVSVIAAVLAGVFLAASLAPLFLARSSGMETGDPTAVLNALRTALPAIGIFLIVITVLSLLAQAIVIGGAEHVWNGQPPDLAGGVGKALARLPSLIGLLIVAIIFACICIVLTFLIIGPFLGLILAFFFMYALPAIVVSGAGTFDALGISWRLVRQNLGPSVMAFLGIVVVNIVGSIIQYFLQHIPVVGLVVNLIVGGLLAAYAALVVVRFYDLLRAGAAPPAVAATGGQAS